MAGTSGHSREREQVAMSTAAMTFDPWCVQYTETLAAATTVGSAIRRRCSYVQLATDFWRVNRKFKSLLSTLDEAKMLPEDGAKELLARLRTLRATVNSVLDLAGKRGLCNRTIISGSILTLRKRNDELLDFVERLELSVDPAVYRCLDEALEEYRSGTAIPIESLL